MQEEWKAVVGFEGLYEVSNFGKVRSLPRQIKLRNGITHQHKGYVLKCGRDGGGYQFVILRKNGKSFNRKIHRLVAETFVSKKDKSYDTVNHIDENIDNNTSSNLEWCTNRYNLDYGHRRTREVDTRGTKIAQYSKNGKLIAVYPSIGEASRRTGIGRVNIASITRYPEDTNFWGKKRTSGGFIWKRGKDIDEIWNKSNERQDFLSKKYDSEMRDFVDKRIFKEKK